MPSGSIHLHPLIFLHSTFSTDRHCQQTLKTHTQTNITLSPVITLIITWLQQQFIPTADQPSTCVRDFHNLFSLTSGPYSGIFSSVYAFVKRLVTNNFDRFPVIKKILLSFVKEYHLRCFRSFERGISIDFYGVGCCYNLDVVFWK
jgi:hypothetical protein